MELNRQLSGFEQALLVHLQQRGISLAFVGLCGVGDDMWRGGLWEFAPLLLAQTHVGFHAEEIIRSTRWAIETLGASKVFLAALGGGIGAAMLHAAPHLLTGWPRNGEGFKSRLAGIALVNELCSYRDVAVARQHRLPWMMQMYGVLEHYDLPDLLATLGRVKGPAALVVRPLGASGRPISRACAFSKLHLARQRFAGRGGGGSGLRIIARQDRGSAVSGGHGEPTEGDAEMLAHWMARVGSSRAAA